MPQSPGDLDEHVFVIAGPVAGKSLTFRRGEEEVAVRPTGRVAINDAEVAVSAVGSGLGVAVASLPAFAQELGAASRSGCCPTGSLVRSKRMHHSPMARSGLPHARSSSTSSRLGAVYRGLFAGRINHIRSHVLPPAGRIADLALFSGAYVAIEKEQVAMIDEHEPHYNVAFQTPGPNWVEGVPAGPALLPLWLRLSLKSKTPELGAHKPMGSV